MNCRSIQGNWNATASSPTPLPTYSRLSLRRISRLRFQSTRRSPGFMANAIEPRYVHRQLGFCGAAAPVGSVTLVKCLLPRVHFTIRLKLVE
jgi:hypothetical protein